MKNLIPFAAVLVSVILILGCVSPNNYGNEGANGNDGAGNGTENDGAGDAGGTSSGNGNGGVDMIAEKGDTVAVDYLGTLDNGTVFDTSIKEEAEKANLPVRPYYQPLEFKVGAGQMIKGFDDAVVGMKVGDEKTVKIAPADAYGEWSEDGVITVPIDRVPENISVGTILSSSTGAVGKVIEMNSTDAKIDFNHELAGKSLNFKIIMRKITK